MKNRNRRFWKRALAMLLTVCMVMTTLVGNAFAFSLADIPVLFAGEEKQENRAELKDYFFFSDKVSIYLTSSKLRETALEAIQNGQTVDPEEIHRAVSSDAGLAKDYNEFFFSGREVYEITLPEEVKETMADSGLDFRAFVRSGNVADDYKEKGAVRENAGNLKNLVLYQSGSSLDFLMSEADLNPAIREARNDDYTLTGNEEIAFVFFNNTDEKETFVLNIDNKNYCSVKVGSRETALRGLLKEVQKILKKQAKAQAKEDGEDEDKPVKASGSSAAQASGSNAAVASGSDAVIASASDAEKDPAVFLDQDEVEEIESNFSAYAEDSSAGKFAVYTLAELAMDHYQNTDVEGYDIEVFVNKDAFSEPVELKVTKLVKPEDEAEENADILSAEQIEMLKKKGAYENSQSFDVRFENAAGAEIEPKGTAKVRITADKAVLPEGMDLTSMQVFHMKENASGKIEKIENLTGEEALSASLKLLDDQDQEILSLSAISEDADDAAFEATGAIVDDTASAKGIAAPQMTEEEAEEINAQTAKVVADVVLKSFSTITLAPLMDDGDPTTNPTSGVGSMELTLVGGSGDVVITGAETITDWNAKQNEIRVLSYTLKFKKDGLTEKQLQVKVPTGWMIKGVSAKEGQDLGGSACTDITIDNEYKDVVSSVTLDPATGTTSVTGTVTGDTWEEQRLEGYALKDYTEDVRTYGGDVLFKFTDDAQIVDVVIQIAPQTTMLSHTAETEAMPTIVSTMSATSKTDGSVKEESVDLNVTVKHVPVLNAATVDRGLDGKKSVNVKNGTDGFSSVFGVGVAVTGYDPIAAAGGAYNGYVDTMDYTFTYPEGVYFTERVSSVQHGLGGVDNGGTSITQYLSSTEKRDDGSVVKTYLYRSPENLHLKITNIEHPEGGGTVTFAYDKVVMIHNSSNTSIVADFKARTSKCAEGYKYFTEQDNVISGFTGAGSFTRNSVTKNFGKSSYTRTLRMEDGDTKFINMGDPNAAPVKRQDLMNGKLEAEDTSAIGVDKISALGFRNITSELEYSNNTFYFEAPPAEKVQVTGLQLFGKNIRNVMIKTTKGNILVIPKVEKNGGEYSGAFIKPAMLKEAGMEDGDYIKEARFTCDLNQLTYHSSYVYGSFIYNGRFVQGEVTEGETVKAKLTLLEDLPKEYEITKGDQYEDTWVPSLHKMPSNGKYENSVNISTMVEWSGTGVGAATAFAGKKDKPAATTTTYYPNDDIYFKATVSGGSNTQVSDNIVDPIVIFTLPNSVTLNTEYGVKAVSADGKSAGAEVTLVPDGEADTTTKPKYTIYRYKVPDSMEHGQLVALENSNNDIGKSSSITVYAKAHVESTSPQYVLKLQDVIRWDLRRTAISASSGVTYAFADTDNVAGKGTDYKLASAGDSINIKPLVGLNMDLSLRAVFDQTFHTYNGQKSTISLVQPKKYAVMRLNYESTNEKDYYQNTCIYLPIPKKDINYNKYFENIAVTDPGNYEGKDWGSYSKENKFSFYLAKDEEGNLPIMKSASGEVKWTTEYAVAKDSAAASNTLSHDDYTEIPDKWEPAMKIGGGDLEWHSWDKLCTMYSSHTAALDDVVMLRFTANQPIHSKETGSVEIRVRVDDNAKEEQYDFWRAYGKSVHEPPENMEGNWNYSSVVGATPASERVFGQIFLDLNGDNVYTAGTDKLYTGSDVKVNLNTMKDGAVSYSKAFYNEGGYLRMLSDPNDPTSSDKFLSGGDYTVSAVLDSSNKDYVLSTTVPSDTHSNGYNGSAVWANDYTASDYVVVEVPEGADTVGVNAGGTFTVVNSAAINHYFGVALKPVVKANFNIQKNLGREWKTGDSFKFTVAGGDDDTPLPINKTYLINTDSADHQVTTGDITFDAADTYTYTITEDKAGTTENGITYAADAQTVTITVEPDTDSEVAGKLKATVTYADAQAAAAVFENTYAATGTTTIAGTKTLKFTDGTEITPQTADQFEFKIEPVSAVDAAGETIANVPMPASDTAGNTANGTFAFEEITYTQGGTYTYHVFEVAGSDTTITYDDTVYTVAVHAVDKLDGTITCTQTVKKADETEADAIAFENVRSYEPATAVVEAEKTLHGRNLVDGEFTFQLTAVTEGAPELADMTAVNEGTSVAFEEIEFPAPGTYEYTLKEVKPEPADTHMDYSTDEVTVRVVVGLKSGTTNELEADVQYFFENKKENNPHKFTNTFKADPITAQIGVMKTLDGRVWIDDDSYSFNLAAGEENTAVKPDGSAAGIDTPMPAPDSIDVTKDSTPVDGDQYSRTGLFGNITFQYAGVYNYTITENEGQIGGITYDESTINVTVTVTADDTTGALEAEVAYSGDSDSFAAFTNLYTVLPAKLVLGGTKTLATKDGTSKTVNNGQFKFKIEPQGTAPAAASAEVYNDEEANFTFGAISFTEEGEYTYLVSEVAGTDATIEYDDAVYTYVVTVTDELDGTLSYTVKDETGAEIGEDAYLTHAKFANIYNYDPIDVDLDVTKVLAGRALQAEEFSFRLTGAAGYPMPEGADTPEGSTLQEKTAVNDADGKVDFGSIRYEMPGTYRYHITEMIPDDADKLDNVTYDTTDFEVLVNVSQLTGSTELVAQVTYNRETKAEFKNVYTPDPTEAEIEVSKTLEGRAWTDNDSFDFTIEGSGNENVTDSEGNPVVIENPMPETATLTITKGADEAAAYSGAFGEISFAYEGVYHYAITETPGQAGGVAYDGSTVEVDVQVTADETTGELLAEVIYLAQTEAAEFTNIYTVTPAELVVNGTKTYTKNDGETALDIEDGQFSFEISSDNADAPLPAETTVEVSADGSFGFGAITYEAAGEYTYTISEKAGDDPNMAYDDTEYTVVVTVADNNEGALVITAKVNGEDKELTQEESVYTLSDISFANKTKFAPVTGNIEVAKKLEGRSLKENEFEFTLTPVGGTTYYGDVAADDVPMPEETAASNDADGKVLFGDITYETEGEYVYEIRETKGSLKNVQYDENVITAHVSVTAAADTASGLKVDVTFDNDVDTFTNIYTPDPVSQALAVKKTLTGRPWQDWDEFTFKLTAKDGAPAPAETEIKVTGDAEASFNAAEYTEAGRYVYEIKETTTPKFQAKGVTYDTHTETVTVEVSYDAEAGKLSIASVKYSGSDTATAAEFENVYKAEPVDLTLQGRKSIEDTTNDGSVKGNNPKKISDYDGAFSFTLASDSDAAPLPQTATVTNDGQGKFAFDTITFEESGEYSYTITEDAVDTDANPGVTGDDTTYNVIVTVNDNYETGKLEISSVAWEPETESGKAEFLNIYAAEPTTAEIKGSKELKDRSRAGRLLEEGAYKFHAAAVTADAPLPENTDVTNDADGNFVFNFADDAFKQVGIYQYNVTEVQPEAGTVPDGYSYDPSVYLVNIKVTDDGNAKLAAEVSYQKTTGTDAGTIPEEAHFTNSYQARKTTATLRGEKLLDDLTSLEAWGLREIGDGEFEFTLTPESGFENGEQDADHSEIALSEIPMPDADTVVVNDADGKFVFGEIEYKHAGDYYYLITETEGSVRGMTYDTVPKLVQVHVEDPVEPEGKDQEAQLYATISYLGDYQPEQNAIAEPAAEDGAKVKNVYAADPVDVVIDGTKVFDDLTNRTATAKTLEAEEFRFTLTAEDDAPMPEDAEEGTATASNAEPKETNNAVYAFGAITYEKEGIYTYTLKEVNDVEKGVEYDETEYKVTVTVVDGAKEGEGRHDGRLKASVEITGGGKTSAEFENPYSAKPTTAELKGFKQFYDMTNKTEGAKTLAAGDFSFELKADGNTAGIKADGEAVVNPMPEGTVDGVATVTNDGDGNFTFGEMTFEYVGEYKYTMTEVNDGKDGVIYDPTVYHFTVTVTDEDAELKAVVTLTAGDKERSTFLSGLAESLTRLIKDLADKIVDFFKGLFGIETEAEAEEGKAEEAPVPVATFSNVYAAEKATASVAVKKTLTDLSSTYKELQEGQFTFTLKASDNNAMAEIPNPMPEGAEDGVATASNAADGSVNFGDMVFQFVGDYTYTVTEVNDGKPGYSYDDTEYTVTVSVTDNADGTLSAEVSYDPEEAAFKNTYKSEKTTLDELDGWKQLTGKPLDQGEFKFEISAEKAEMLKGGDITDEDGKVLTAPLPKETIASNSNAEHMDDEYTGTYEAPFAFGEIEYEHAGIYTYTVKEQAGTDKRVAYDDTAYTVTVTVEDTEEAKLNVTDITYTVDGEEKDEIRFANTFTFDPKKVTFKTTENLWGRTQHAGEFTVLLEPEDEVGTTDEAAKGEATIIGALDRMFNVLTVYAATALSAKNQGEGNSKGNVTFDDLEYKAEDIGKQYIYNMHQEIGTLGGVTYDETNYRIRVTVGVDSDDTTAIATLIEYEDEDGNWAEVTDPEDTFVFDNYYKTEGEAELKVKKVLNGRTLEAEEFEFELYETTGGTRTKLATAKNDANGNVTFPAQAYSRGYVVDTEGKATELKDTSGTHTYEISEVKGTLTRVTYDTTVITATVTAADNEDGTMKVTTTFNPGDTFTNYYRTSGGGGGTPSGGNPGGPSRTPYTPETPETPGAPATPFAPPVLGALPKTGAALGSVMLLALFGILGLFGFARRKKDEDEEE